MTPSQIEAAVMFLAKQMTDRIDVEAMMKEDAQVFEPMLQRLQRSMRVREAARVAWDVMAKEMFVSLLKDRGIVIEDLGPLAQKFIEAFALLITHRMREKPTVLSRRPWLHEAPPPQPVAEPLPQRAEPVWGYVLAFDPLRKHIVYVSGPASGEYGLSWLWNGQNWTADNRIAFRVGELGQPFSGFWDSARRGVACWALRRDNSKGRSEATGLLINAEGVHQIEQTGDPPFGPLMCSLESGVIFGHDEARGVTVAIGRGGVWELDGTGRWSHRIAMPADVMGANWFEGFEGAFYDTAARHLLFYWSDWRDNTLRFCTWDGTTLHALPADGWRAARGFTGTLLRQGDTLMALSTRDGRFTLVDGVWTPRDGEVPRINVARAAADPERDQIVVGPARIPSPSGARLDDHSFHIWAAGQWRRTGEQRVGTGTAKGQRLLCGTSSGVYALTADFRLLHYKDKSWIELAPADTARRAPAAMTASADGTLWVVDEQGAVLRYTSGAWQQAAAASPLFLDRLGFCLAFDEAGKRLVAWGGKVFGAASDETLAFDGTDWQILFTAGSPLPADEARARARSESTRYFLIYDSFLGRLVLFSGNSVAALHDDRWLLLSTQKLRPGLDPAQRFLFHHPATKETLGLCLRERRLVRFDLKEFVIVAEVEAPGPGASLESALTARPLEADWVFDPAAAELCLFVDDSLLDSYTLALDEVLRHAASRGPRTPYSYQKPHDLRPDILAVLDSIAQAIVIRLTDEDAKRLTGLPFRQLTEGLMRTVAVEVWRGIGVPSVAEACARANIDMNAVGISVIDTEPYFVLALTKALQAKYSWKR